MQLCTVFTSPRVEYSDLPVRMVVFVFIVQVRAVTSAGEGVWRNASLGLQAVI